MSKVTEFIEKIKNKLSIKTVLYIVIGLFLFKSCQGCNRANKIERLEKTHIVVVDSLTKRIDSLNVANDKLATVIEGKNEVNSVQIENGEFYQYKINTLNEKITEFTDTIAEKDRQIKQLKSTIKRKDGEISNLNIEINRLKVENERLKIQE